MKTIERQILAALDRLHRELVSNELCRWQYDGSKDLYSCSHVVYTGHQVIGLVEQMNHYSLKENDG